MFPRRRVVTTVLATVGLVLASTVAGVGVGVGVAADAASGNVDAGTDAADAAAGPPGPGAGGATDAPPARWATARSAVRTASSAGAVVPDGATARPGAATAPTGGTGTAADRAARPAGSSVRVSAAASRPAVAGRNGTTVVRNRTLVRVNVSTLTDAGNYTNATVAVEVADNDTVADPAVNVSGGWKPTVVGGTGTRLRRVRNGSDRIVIDTGADGNATVFYRTDRAPVELFPTARYPFDPVNDTDPNTTGTQTGFVGSLRRDPAVYDVKTVRFVGVTDLDPAPVNGLVANNANTPVPNATVYVGDVTLPGGDTIELRPDRPFRPTEFTITLFERRGRGVGGTLVPVENATVDADRLRTGYDFDEFDRLDGSGHGGFVLLTRSRFEPTTGFYTLPRLPAADVPDPGVGPQPSTAFGLEGAAAGADGVLLGTGRAVTRPGVTDDGNVVIEGATPPTFEVRFPAGGPRVQVGFPFRVTATVTNVGDIVNATTLTMRVDTDGDGAFRDESVLDRVEVGRVSPNDSVTVDLRGSGGLTGRLAPGTYAVRVRSTTDRGLTNLTVVDDAGCDRFDADCDGHIDAGEVLAVVEAYTRDRLVDGRPVTARDVLAVVAAFNSDGRV